MTRDRPMSVPTTGDVPTGEDVIALEPRVDADLAGVRAALAPPSSKAMTAGSPSDSAIASVVGETGSLRRHRLAATALLLAVAYAILLAWHLWFLPPHG